MLILIVKFDTYVVSSITILWEKLLEEDKLCSILMHSNS